MSQHEKMTRRELGQQIRGWFLDPSRQPDDVVPSHVQDAMREKAILTEQTRRTFLRRVGLAVGVPILIDKTGIALWELAVPTLNGAEIGWMPGQEERLKDTDSLCLVFGGATIRNPEGLIEHLASDLAPFGAVGHVDYANNEFDIEGIADRIEDQQRKHPHITKISVYGHSLGALVASRVFQELENRGSSIKLEHLLMDCTPPDISYTDQASLFDPLATLFDWMNGSSILTAASNMQVYNGRPYHKNAAPPRLAEAQGVIMQEGMKHLAYLSKRVEKDQAKVGFLTPENPVNDDVTDAVRSRQTLQAFFPRMDTFFLETEIDPQTQKEKPLHASPDYHAEVYKKALAKAREKWGIHG